MRFVDFALQGFLDLRQAGQLRFGSTLTAVATAPCAAQTLVDGLVESIFASGYDPAAVRFAAVGASSTRAVITFQTVDESVFRLVRDIVRGSAQLLSYRAQAGDFVPVATDATEIDQFLRGRIGVPSREVFTRAFVVGPQDLPSWSGSGSGPEVTDSPSSRTVQLSERDRAHLTQRVAHLKRALEAHREVSGLNERLDAMHTRRVELEGQLARRDMDTTAVDEAAARYETLRYLEALPDDFALRVEFYHEASTRRTQELSRWELERDTLERDARTLHIDPIVNDWRLWSGLGVGVVAFAMGFVLSGAARLIALLDIPAFGLSGFVIWQYLGSLESRDLNRRRLSRSDRRKEYIVTRDEQAIREVLQAMEEVGHDDPDEVVRRLEGMQVAKAEHESAERAYRAAQADPELQRFKAEHSELLGSITEFEHRLASSSLGGEASRVEAEIREIEGQLVHGQITMVNLRSPVGPKKEQSAGVMKGFVAAASELVFAEPDEVAKRLNEAARPLVAHLSSGRVTSVELSPQGDIAAGAERDVRPLLALPEALQDVVYLALRAALPAIVDERMRSPFIICGLDEALAGRAAFVTAYASLVAQHAQTVSISRKVAPGWPEGTTMAALAST